MSTVDSSISVNPREQRGAQIAAAFKLRKRGDDWLVPSQSGAGTYRVRMGEPHLTCSCPDRQLRRVKCNHTRAVEIGVRREERPDGTTVVTRAVCTTYKQKARASECHADRHCGARAFVRQVAARISICARNACTNASSGQAGAARSFGLRPQNDTLVARPCGAGDP